MSKPMPARLAALVALLATLLITACSKVNQENFLKGVSGTASRWVAGDTVITARFVNGSVAFKSFDKPRDKGK